ncbi:tripartite tricarboxylate transporter TctB family protein [Desulfovibrio aminophilus]|nr:tripartite tricarboxylate transporter TctB family protein [Desulfovibrio aminophilus]MCM0755926.1 tripartite tricarboxylate transporter TctB family protein [Desulfovibrio aminophilus]
MKIKTGDCIMALILLAFSAALYQQSTLIDTSMIYALGPVFFPRILIGILAVLSLVLLFQSLGRVDGKTACAAGASSDGRATFILRWGLVGLTVLYLLLLPLLGYVAATIPFLFAGMCLLGPCTRKHLAIYGVVSAGITLGLQYIFASLLKLFLP